MLDGWGGSTEPWDDVESDDDYGWSNKDNKDREDEYNSYQEDRNNNDKKYYMPEFPDLNDWKKVFKL